jgi:NTP pyrophosphatase (non-canonical NTP hydrolase)
MKKEEKVCLHILEKQVLEWAYDRGIFAESTEKTRFAKFMEEIQELIDELWPVGRKQDLEKIKMEAGDVLVTLINLLHPYNLDLKTCLAAAYEKIKDRDGKMIGGTFVKKEDLL